MSAPVIAFDDLRRAVESAHGHTGEAMCLCERALGDGGTETVLITQAEYDRTVPRPRLILRTERAGVAAAHEARVKVSLEIDGVARASALPGFEPDAVFATQSAIEKFFFPYYQRVLPYEEFAALQRRYYEPVDEASRIVAFTHYPPSIYIGEGRTRDAGTAETPAVLARAAGGLRPQVGALRANGRYVRNLIDP